MAKVIAIEGKGNFGFIEKFMFSKYGHKLHHKSFSYRDEIPEKLKPVGIVAHSFGVKKALEYAAKTKSVKFVLTIDGRHPDLLSWFDILIPWRRDFKIKPERVEEISYYNYYQKGFMPGYRVIGARNFKIKSSHALMPNHIDVNKEFIMLLTYFLPRS